MRPLHLHFDRQLLLGKRALSETWMWQNVSDSIVSSCSASCITQMKTCRQVIVKDVCRQGQIVFCNPPAQNLHTSPSPLSSPPTCSLTLCAASRLWTKPISVRYFIPDATPVSISISCITVSWPSCFWGYGRQETRDGKWGKKERRTRGVKRKGQERGEERVSMHSVHVVIRHICYYSAMLCSLSWITLFGE